MRFPGWLRARRWWILLPAALAGAVIALAVSFFLPAQYRAEATLALTGPTASREIQLTYRDLLTSEDHLDDVASGLGLTTNELRDGLRAIPAPGTLLIAVSVTNGDASEAARRANAVADNFPRFLDESGVAASESVIVAQRATSADELTSYAANTLLGAAVGLLAAAAVLVFSPSAPNTSQSVGQSRPEEHQFVDPA